MNTENPTGVKVPKGQINYNTVAGSAGLASFLGLNLRDMGFLGNRGCGGNTGCGCGNGVAAVAETQFVASLMAEIAKEKAERYADNVGINTFKEALTLVTNERETRQANDRITFETLARFDKEIALNKQSVECLTREIATEFVNVRQTLCDKINLEAERRNCADERIIEYSNCHFARTKRVIPASSICPTVQLAAMTSVPARQTAATFGVTSDDVDCHNAID